ncbi:Scytalone dehydratase [Lindgomyces ingoldianus]|uniref:Scytalone dehydratase n=1 Tax=Lindgomyces ingoldianus TaxID=673940 RepID=A0ACB6QPV9_9PLEO|nr:Scytalone dehydratase [Lindgomyces ingoldianus]KAF2468946.1 Scytalone dehydratase [Lindgomyces ingoldianus]
MTGYHQVRTEYKRYKTPQKTDVEATGQGLTLMVHCYKKINGVWKLAGMKPGGRMNEFNFDKIFSELRTSKI